MQRAASLSINKDLEDFMNRLFNRTVGLLAFCVLALSLCVPELSLCASATAQSGGSTGEPQPCPPLEWLCEVVPPDGGWGEDANCICGPGEWLRINRPPLLDPLTPQSSTITSSENFVNWQTICSREATNGTAAVTVGISGRSNFWHAGTKAIVHTAAYSGGWRETWRGTFPACVRKVMLAANGYGTLTIAASCAARPGCTAAVASSAAGMAASRQRASASIAGQSLQGTVAYNELERSTELSGNFGGSVDFWTAEVEGSISSERRWSVKGQGSATGSLSFTVSPDRTYCALTNLPILATWSATLAATATVSVDENGTASSASGAAIALSVQ